MILQIRFEHPPRLVKTMSDFLRKLRHGVPDTRNKAAPLRHPGITSNSRDIRA